MFTEFDNNSCEAENSLNKTGGILSALLSKKSGMSQDRANIIVICCFTGIGLCLHILMKMLYGRVISAIPSLYATYFYNSNVQLLCDMLYTILCVSFPFFLTFFFLNLSGEVDCSLPFGKSKSVGESAMLVIAGIGICMAGNIITSIIVSYADAFGLGFHSFDSAQQQAQQMDTSVIGIILTVIHTAFLPAIFEELTFRGYIMQSLRKYGDWFALVTSGVIFGLAHGNMMQVPFAIIVGIILGIVSIYTGSMWTGIALHFCNNLISVLQSYAVSSVEGASGYLVSYLIIYGMIGVGILALIGYIIGRKRFPSLNKGIQTANNIKWAVFFINPFMLTAVVYMLYSVVRDIYKK